MLKLKKFKAYNENHKVVEIFGSLTEIGFSKRGYGQACPTHILSFLYFPPKNFPQINHEIFIENIARMSNWGQWVGVNNSQSIGTRYFI